MTRLARLEIAVVLFAAALLVLGLWALTRPAIATPLAARAASALSGHAVTIDSARMYYRPMPVLGIEGIEVRDRLTADRLDLAPNLFGLVPGIALLREVRAEDGAILITHSENSMTTDFDAFVDRIMLSGIAVTIRRDAATSRFRIVAAEGSLRGGDLAIDAVAGDGQVWFRGRGGLSDISSVAGAVTVKGDNLASVADALGIAAPDMPPFTINGDLRIDEERWVLTGISGEIGDSDVGGDLSVDFSGQKPFIDADIASQRLDYDDLGVIIGLPSSNEDGAELNEAQAIANESYRASGRFIPDARIDMERLSMVDAEIAYGARTVRDAPFGIAGVSFDLTLTDSVLTIRTIEAELAQGRMALSGTLDASRTPAETQLDARFADLDLETIVPGRAARGMIEGRAELALTGSDFRTAFARSDGTVSFWGEDVQLAAIPVEAAGLDLGEILLLLGGDEDGEPVYVDTPCLVARLEIEDGIGRTRPFVADTEDSTVVADGTIGLREETLDLELSSDAKDLSWGRFLGGVTIGGHWREPDIGLSGEATAIQALFAAALSSIAAPLAGLAFIEPGDGEEAPCASLLAQARAVTSG